MEEVPLTFDISPTRIFVQGTNSIPINTTGNERISFEVVLLYCAANADVKTDRHSSLGTFGPGQLVEGRLKLDCWNHSNPINVLLQYLKTLIVIVVSLRPEGSPQKEIAHTDQVTWMAR
ncbi:hypothetical protein TNCV_852781 [Trichonephila clavipes]|nr:hypothetical protein TNCV_852781 [Trichonephila clavipes]